MRPGFRIAADGADITPRIADRLVSIEVLDATGEDADRLTVAIDARAPGIALPPRGAVLTLAMGLDGDLVDMGSYVADRLSGEGPPAVLTIAARSADLNTGIRAPRSGHWTDTSLGEIAAVIVRRHGLRLLIERGLAKKEYAHVEQSSESDLHLLTRLAKDLDALVKVAEGGIVIAPQGANVTLSGRIMEPVALGPRDLSRWSWRLGERQKYGACRAKWGDRKGGRVDQVSVGDGEPVFDLRRVYASRDEAEAAALRKFTALAKARRALALSMATFRGDLGAGQPIALEGVAEGADGNWTVRRATHRLDGSGLTTRIEAAPPDGEGAQ